MFIVGGFHYFPDDCEWDIILETFDSREDAAKFIRDTINDTFPDSPVSLDGCMYGNTVESPSFERVQLEIKEEPKPKGDDNGSVC